MQKTDPSDYQALLDDQARLELAEHRSRSWKTRGWSCPRGSTRAASRSSLAGRVVRANVLRHRPIDLHDVIPKPVVEQGDNRLDAGQRARRVLLGQLLCCLVELAMLGDVGLVRGLRIASRRMSFSSIWKCTKT